MGSPITNRHDPRSLDRMIVKQQASLSRLLLCRITNQLRVGLPGATACHVRWSEAVKGHVPFRVLGWRTRLLWDVRKHGHLAKLDGFKDHHPWRLLDDIALYVKLKPSTLIQVGPHKEGLNPSYSIHLTRLGDDQEARGAKGE